MNVIPMAVNAPANPKLKASTNTKPKPILFKAIAPSNTTNADGQGMMPPEIPSASKLRHVIASGGM